MNKSNFFSPGSAGIAPRCLVEQFENAKMQQPKFELKNENAKKPVENIPKKSQKCNKCRKKFQVPEKTMQKNK